MYKLFDAVVNNTYDLIRFIEPNKMPKNMTKEEMDVLCLSFAKIYTIKSASPLPA